MIDKLLKQQYKKGETMKTIKFLLAVLLVVALPMSGFAQEWDDIYADPTKKETVTIHKKAEPEPQKKVVIVQGEVSNMDVIANGRDIDEYNRRYNENDEGISEDQAYNENVGDYTEYEYTDRILRFHDPESSIKITGADEVIVYIGDDLYDGYNNRDRNTNVYLGMGFGSFYPWYDPWYYTGWYDPWFYNPWYYRHYDPWYYGYGYNWGRWHRPWYFSSWHQIGRAHV